MALCGVERAGSETPPEMFFLTILGNDDYLKHEINDYLDEPELQKRADRADQSVLSLLAGANFWGKARKKQAKSC